MTTFDPQTVFAQVDRSPDPAALVQGMDDTARWAAVQELRALTAEFLRVGPGARVLDVGCGPGDVVIGFARSTGPSGRAVGIDASAVMLAAARARAAEVGVAAEFAVGDASALDFPDDTFDASRSERTFQWLPDAAGALAEMVRVTRPGGAVVVIDSDWATFSFEHPDRAASRKVIAFLETSRGEQMVVGRRLRGMFRRAGLADVVVAARAAVFTEWDPDTQPGPPGLMPMDIFANTLVGAGVFTPDEGAAWLAELAQAARDGDFCGSLTIYAVCGRKPL